MRSYLNVRNDYTWITCAVVVLTVVFRPSVGNAQREAEYETTTTTTSPPPPPPVPEGSESRPNVLNPRMKMGRWSPHAGGQFNFPKTISIEGHTCIVSVDYESELFEDRIGVLVEVARAADGAFVYGKFTSSFNRDCDIFDQAMNKITSTNQGRSLERGDVMPTYTYSLSIDWNTRAFNQKCVWFDQGDDGPMRTTLTSPDCTGLKVVWENAALGKWVKLAQKWIAKKGF